MAPRASFSKSVRDRHWKLCNDFTTRMFSRSRQLIGVQFLCFLMFVFVMRVLNILAGQILSTWAQQTNKTLFERSKKLCWLKKSFWQATEISNIMQNTRAHHEHCWKCMHAHVTLLCPKQASTTHKKFDEIWWGSFHYLLHGCRFPSNLWRISTETASMQYDKHRNLYKKTFAHYLRSRPI